MTLADIAAAVAARHGLTQDALSGPGKTRRLAYARQEYMALAREQTTKSLAQIGRVIGRHHSTVLTGARAYWERMQ